MFTLHSVDIKTHLGRHLKVLDALRPAELGGLASIDLALSAEILWWFGGLIFPSELVDCKGGETSVVVE